MAALRPLDLVFLREGHHHGLQGLQIFVAAHFDIFSKAEC